MSAIRDASARATPVKSAAVGFGITLAWVAALASIQFLLVPYTVAVVGRMDPEIDDWAISAFRSQLAEAYAIVASILAAYWLLSAILGKGRFLEVKNANLTLALSGLVFALAMAVASLVPVPRAFKGACPILGLSDSLPSLSADRFGFDGQSPCETFLNRALPSLLLGLPLILLIASAVLRIVGSRKH
jgi:hypothetical protein